MNVRLRGRPFVKWMRGGGGGLNLKSGLSENYTYFVENIKDKVTALYILYTSQFQPCFVLAAILK